MLFATLGEFPTLYLPASFILGLLIGSFLNVVIYRLPVMMEREWKTECLEYIDNKKSANIKEEAPFNLATPASRCQKCEHKITAIENIPILSYLWLKGRCRSCKDPISSRYPIIEFISGILTFFVVYHFGYSVQALAACFFTWSLIALFMIDVDHYLLPDIIVIPLLWLGLILNLFNVYTDSHSSIIGAVAGYLFFWIFFQIFKLLTGKEGMGYGDFKLLAALGAWMGWAHLPQIVLLSTLVGSVIGLSMIIFFKRDKQLAIPFGPYLAVAGWISLIWGDQINQQYLHFAGFS